MKRVRNILTKVILIASAVLLVTGFSAFHARKACDEIVRAEIAPPPRQSTRFVLYPSRHMSGAEELGFKPGWVVSYVPWSREYGTAFFVSFFGKMLARGTPDIVTQQHKQDEITLKKFRDRFAQFDAKVQVGSPFTEVVSILGEPQYTHTNDDGSLFVVYHYHPNSLRAVDWLTNGFSLAISNDIVARKDYSYTSLR